MFENEINVLRKVVDSLEKEYSDSENQSKEKKVTSHIVSVINECGLNNNEKMAVLDFVEMIGDCINDSGSNWEETEGALIWSDNVSRYKKLYLDILGLRGESSIITYPEDLIESFKEVIMELEPKGINVIRMRYGLGRFKPMTLIEIGKKCGVTSERIRQIESKAFRKLRYPNRVNRVRFGIKKFNQILADKQEEKDREEECRILEHKKLLQNIEERHNDVMKDIRNPEVDASMILNAFHVNIDDMDMSCRPNSCLRRKGLYYADDFFMMNKNQMLKIRAFGTACHKEVEKALNAIAMKNFGIGIEEVRKLYQNKTSSGKYR